MTLLPTWTHALAAHPMPLLQWGVVLGACMAAATMDAASRRIPNLLTLPLLVAGLVSSALFAGTAGLADALAAMVLLGLPYVLLFVFAGGGAGDAKLMGAIGAWLGLANGVVVLGSVSLCGVLLALAFAHAGGSCLAALASVGCLARGTAAAVFGRLSLQDVQLLLPPARNTRKIPYGLAICTGAALAAGTVFLWRYS